MEVSPPTFEPESEQFTGIHAIPVAQETPRDEPIHSVSRACITSLTQSSRSPNASTVKFERLVIRSNLVLTLKKIWTKHGNIVGDSILRNGDMVVGALELVATVMLILEDNSARSLSDHQAEYLSYALSDLQLLQFKVDWLVPSLEKALALHRSKPLLDSLKNLRRTRSQAAELRSKLVNDLTKLVKTEKELEEDMAMVSKKIPFTDEAKLEQPLGVGLTDVELVAVCE